MSTKEVKMSKVYKTLEDAVRDVRGLTGILRERVYVPLTEKSMFTAMVIEGEDPLDFKYSNRRCPVVVVAVVLSKHTTYAISRGYSEIEGNEVYEKGFILN